MNTLIFSAALAAYFALHSLLAAEGVKAKLTLLVPPRYYRLGYNLLAAVLLAAIFTLYFLMEKKPFLPPTLVFPLVGGVLALAGAAWVARALKRYGFGEFSGLEQLREGQQPKHSKLIIRGLNGRVRHPLYFGILLMAWGALFILPTDLFFAFSLTTTIYTIIGARLEEEKLVAQFGKAYQKYQREVPMLVPFRFRFRRR